MKPKKPEYWIEPVTYFDGHSWFVCNRKGDRKARAMHHFPFVGERNRDMLAFSRAAGLPIRKTK